MTTPSISFSGLASGIDTSSIISQLTTVAQKPITLLQGKDDGYNAELSAWQTFNSNLASLQTAVTTLSAPATFSAASATSSNTSVATVTALAGATIGSHSLSVTQRAQAQKVVSTSVASSSTPLGQAGSFTLNGKTVAISSSDALNDVAAKINAAKAGVSATVVTVGPNDFRLTLASTQSGAAHTIAASDTSGSVLQNLGVLGSSAATVRQGLTYTQNGTSYTGGASLTLSSATQPVGSLLGLSSGQAPTGSFHISNGGTGTGNEADIAIDLNTASLTDVANAINQAGITGVSAEVVTLPDVNGNLGRIHQLQIVNKGSSPTASTATASGTSLLDTDTFSGTVAVNGQTVTLAGHATTLAQLNTAIQSTTGNSGIVATVSAGALVLTDASGQPITAATTGLDNWTGGTADNGPLGAAVSANGTPAANAAPAFTDTSGILASLGVLQTPFTQTVTTAQDAKFTLDGLDLTRSSNTIGDLIPGATLKLLSGTSAAPGTADITIAQNTDTIVQAVNSLASAYNAIQDFVTTQNKFTPPTDTKAGVAGTNAPLFGDTTLSQIQDQLSRVLTAAAGTTTLQSIGITLGQDGKLTVDSTALTTALQTDPTSVSNLFSASGTSDDGGIQFVSAGPKTAATSGTGYDVNITQPATQSSGAAQTARTLGSVSSVPEALTFGGSLFSTGTKLTVPAGSTLQDTVSLINNTSSLNSSLYASIDSSNHLVIASQRYGSNNGFSVSSDGTATATNSGIGPILTVTYGVDVAGTINGEPASGTGRTLTGNSGNATTEGLQLLVSATTASGTTPSHIKVTHGVADGLSQTLTQLLDPVNGAVAGAETSLNSQISDTQAQITKIQTEIDAYKDYLTQIFSAMETRVSALQAQGNAFAASIGSISNSSSSSSSGGSLKSS